MYNVSFLLSLRASNTAMPEQLQRRLDALAAAEKPKLEHASSRERLIAIQEREAAKAATPGGLAAVKAATRPAAAREAERAQHRMEGGGDREL